MANGAPEQQPADPTRVATEDPRSIIGDDGIELRVAPTLHNVRLIRLMATGVADAVGFDLDALDDLRIGVDELSALAIDCAGGGGDRLTVCFTVDDHHVVMEGLIEGGEWDSTRRADGPGGLAGTILAAVVDEFRIEPHDAGVGFSLRKRIEAP